MMARLALIGWFWAAGWLMAAAAASTCQAGPSDGETLPGLTAMLRFEEAPSFCGESLPLDDLDTRERLERELLLTVWDRPRVILWFKRLGRYGPHIETTLRQRGLPDDLKYLAVAESALLPNAGSSKGAVGFWQFIRPTGERYGLSVDQQTDERRSLFSSTGAALDYLRDLHAQFGSWSLAAAAYNMGENGLQEAIALQETRNYFRLYLPEETQRYLFRIVAAKMVLSQPEKYGFRFTPGDSYPPLAADRVTLTVARRLPLMAVAKAARTDYKAIRDLNPQLRDSELPAGRIEILVPAGAAAGFHERLEALAAMAAPAPVPPPTEAAAAAPVPSPAAAKKGPPIHTVQRGETLTAIAARYGVAIEDLRRWNHLKTGSVIKSGDRLVLGAR
jgi:hypothetical protein